jgi:ATP-dependent RNA helicase DDX54/DBP10
MVATPQFAETHMLFDDDMHDALREKEKMLERIQGFRPAETVFEIGKRGTGSETAEIMRKRREQVGRQKEKQRLNKANEDLLAADSPSAEDIQDVEMESDDDQEAAVGGYDSDSDDLEVSISQPSSKHSKTDDFRSSEFFMSYLPTENAAEEKAYGVSGGDAGNTNNFVTAARSAEMSLLNDENQGFADSGKGRMRWDKKSKKYVSRANDEDGSRGAKMIRGESGQKIAASFRSGRFDDWRKANKVKMQRVGEVETANRTASHNNGPRYKHKGEKTPKPADRYRDDYHVKKKKVDEAKEKRIGAFRDGGAKSEIKDAEGVRKARKMQENRKAKNARPAKKRKF